MSNKILSDERTLVEMAYLSVVQESYQRRNKKPDFVRSKSERSVHISTRDADPFSCMIYKRMLGRDGKVSEVIFLGTERVYTHNEEIKGNQKAFYEGLKKFLASKSDPSQRSSSSDVKSTVHDKKGISFTPHRMPMKRRLDQIVLDQTKDNPLRRAKEVIYENISGLQKAKPFQNYYHFDEHGLFELGPGYLWVNDENMEGLGQRFGMNLRHLFVHQLDKEIYMPYFVSQVIPQSGKTAISASVAGPVEHLLSLHPNAECGRDYQKERDFELHFVGKEALMDLARWKAGCAKTSSMLNMFLKEGRKRK